jgi:hypothetical protein
MSRLTAAIDKAWQQASSSREPLEVAAARQIALSRAAYSRIHGLVAARNATAALSLI